MYEHLFSVILQEAGRYSLVVFEPCASKTALSCQDLNFTRCCDTKKLAGNPFCLQLMCGPHGLNFFVQHILHMLSLCLEKYICVYI